MTTWLPQFVDIAACIIIAARLLLFRRRDRRHRMGMAVTAWGMINLSVLVIIHLLCYPVTQPMIAWLIAGLLALLAWLVCRAEGNVAKLVRIGLQGRIRAWF